MDNKESARQSKEDMTIAAEHLAISWGTEKMAFLPLQRREVNIPLPRPAHIRRSWLPPCRAFRLQIGKGAQSLNPAASLPLDAKAKVIATGQGIISFGTVIFRWFRWRCRESFLRLLQSHAGAVLRRGSHWYLAKGKSISRNHLSTRFAVRFIKGLPIDPERILIGGKLHVEIHAALQLINPKIGSNQLLERGQVLKIVRAGFNP